MDSIDTQRRPLRQLLLAAGIGMVLIVGACAPYQLAGEHATERANRQHDGGGMHGGGGHG